MIGYLKFPLSKHHWSPINLVLLIWIVDAPLYFKIKGKFWRNWSNLQAEFTCEEKEKVNHKYNLFKWWQLRKNNFVALFDLARNFLKTSKNSVSCWWLFWEVVNIQIVPKILEQFFRGENVFERGTFCTENQPLNQFILPKIWIQLKKLNETEFSFTTFNKNLF